MVGVESADLADLALVAFLVVFLVDFAADVLEPLDVDVVALLVVLDFFAPPDFRVVVVLVVDVDFLADVVLVVDPDFLADEDFSAEADFVVVAFFAVVDLPADADLVLALPFRVEFDAVDLAVPDAAPRFDPRLRVVFAPSSSAVCVVLDVERVVTGFLSKADRPAMGTQQPRGVKGRCPLWHSRGRGPNRAGHRALPDGTLARYTLTGTRGPP